jgi:hypothetical protein
MSEFFSNDLGIKFSDDMVTIINRAQEELGHNSKDETVNNFLCAGIILDALLDAYPQVEAAYNDYKAKTMAARGQ